jgi:hypothetical protein
MPFRYHMYIVTITSEVLRLRRKDLVSAVMTTRPESRISHGLLVVRSWLTDPSADVALVLLFSCITCITGMTHS